MTTGSGQMVDVGGWQLELAETTRPGDVHYAGDVTVAWFKDPDGNILSIQNSDVR
ncbi:MAG: hypothetical protein ACRENP_22635 [Longimicrobiales bacterium]